MDIKNHPCGYAAKAAARQQMKASHAKPRFQTETASSVSAAPPRSASPSPCLSYATPLGFGGDRKKHPTTGDRPCGGGRDGGERQVSQSHPTLAHSAASDSTPSDDSAQPDLVTLERADLRKLVMALQNLRTQRTADLDTLRLTREALASVARLALLEAPDSEPLRALVNRLVEAGQLGQAQAAGHTHAEGLGMVVSQPQATTHRRNGTGRGPVRWADESS